MTKYFALTLFSLLLVLGQTLFKKASQTLPTEPGMTMAIVMAMMTNVWLWLAVCFYGLSTVLWVLILRTTPLSVAYPFVALGFIFVPIVSWWLFNETIRLPYVFGVVLILAGVFTIVWSTEQTVRLP